MKYYILNFEPACRPFKYVGGQVHQYWYSLEKALQEIIMTYNIHHSLA